MNVAIPWRSFSLLSQMVSFSVPILGTIYQKDVFSRREKHALPGTHTLLVVDVHVITAAYVEPFVGEVHYFRCLKIILYAKYLTS